MSHCQGCAALEAEYGSDRILLTFLKKRLLKRGWSGPRSPAEQKYIQEHATWSGARRGPETK